MPKIEFRHGDQNVSCGMHKVDRSKLYGYATTVVKDENSDRCDLATLANDGKTLIPGGGTGSGYLSPDGLWREKGDLDPVNPDGEKLEPVTSTLKEAVDLSEKASVEEYLEHNIRMVYALEPEEAEFGDALLKELADGAIYKFPFSYRGGLDPDGGFLLSADDGTVFLAVGKKAHMEFVGFEQVAPVVEEEEEDAGAGEALDFGMI